MNNQEREERTCDERNKMERVKEDGVRGPTHLLRHTALHMQTRIAEQTPLLRVRHGKLTNCLPVCVCVCV